MYVTDLAAPGCVNTMPEGTIQAVYNHGIVEADTIRAHYEDAQETLDTLKDLGIEYHDVVSVLEREGVDKFEASWNRAHRVPHRRAPAVRWRLRPARGGFSWGIRATDGRSLMAGAP